ncbi:hypothetical protein GCM10027034_37590 [Ramlibacter solisilvae]|uniref:hypothetical protein n=1 Tax=Ramlibacter tataouinensis TaxID=94132 RepID=UPI000777A9FB|nr:hypothetical protein [Ramlibacter tataouinensis]
MANPGEADQPLFMSEEHVRIMNDRLAKSDEVKNACAALPRDVLLAFRLVNEDTGAVHWWQMSFKQQGGVDFALGEPEGNADLLFESGYWAMLANTAAQRAGEPLPEPQPQMTGDVSVMQLISTAFLATQRAAAVPVRMPPRK